MVRTRKLALGITWSADDAGKMKSSSFKIDKHYLPVNVYLVRATDSVNREHDRTKKVLVATNWIPNRCTVQREFVLETCLCSRAS